MRLAPRALALLASTTLSVGVLASPAYAASPVLVSADPEPGHTNEVPTGVTLTFDQDVDVTSTLQVTGPAGASPCNQEPQVPPDETLECTFQGVPTTNVPDGTYTVDYTADSTGADPSTVGSYQFVLDTVDPVAPTGVTISPDPYNEASTTLTVTGTSESADDTVEVTVTNGASHTKTVDAGAGGAFTATFTAAEVATLNQGTITASATSTDQAGNEGPAGTDTATKDTVDPSVVSTSPADGASDTSAGFSYSATANEPLGAASDIDLFDDDGNQLGTSAPVVGGSTVTVTPSSTLPEGGYTARIKLVDARGNHADPVDRAFTIDDSAPGAPSISTPLPAANAANDQAFPVSGTGEPGATVSVTATDGTPPNATGTATVNGSGNWSTTVDVSSLSDGTLTFTATQTDGAGNTSGPSAEQTTTKDTVAPGTPTVTISPDPVTDANQTAVAVSGSSNGDRVDVVLSDGPGGAADLTANDVPVSAGSYTTSFDATSLSDGTLTASVVAEDTAGNASAAGTDTATKDTTAPAAPTVTISPDPVNDGNKTSVEVSGTSDGASVDVVLSDGPGGAADLTADDVPVTAGSYTTTFDTTPLADGTLTATVVAADGVGNTSAPGSDTAVKDTVAPNPPSVAIAPDPVNASTQGAVTVSGTSNGDTVDVTLSDGPGGGPDLTDTVAVSSGSYSKTFDATALADGTLTATAVAEDAAGNTSTAANDTASKDTVAPGQPATLSGSPSPYLPASTSFTVSGTTAAGDSAATGLTADITVSDTSGATADLVADNVVVNAGAFSAEFSDAQMETLDDGEVTLTATVSDPAGNEGTARTATAVKDTTTLALASTSPADGSSVPSPATVSATYSEALDASSTIQLENDNGVVLAGDSEIDGATITFTPASPLTEGGSPYTATVHAEDPETAEFADDEFSFSVDNTAPAKPTIATVTNPVNNANKAAVSVSGNAAEQGLTVTVTVSDGSPPVVTGTATSGAGGGYTVSGLNVTGLSDGTLTVTASSEDAAGNDSPVSDPATTVKDTVNPTKTSSSPADGSTVQPPATVTITFSEPLGSGSIAIPGVSGTSSFSGSTVTFTPSSGFADGSYTATATVTDTRANPGSGAITFTVNDAAAATTTTLNALPAEVTYGTVLTLAGKVTRTDTSTPIAGVRITRQDDSGQVVTVGTATPDAAGNYSLSYLPEVNGAYTATYLGDAENTSSQTTSARSLVAVAITAKTKTGPADKLAKVKGTVAPNKAGRKVRLYEVGTGGKLTLLDKVTVKPNGRFVFKVSLPKGKTKLQVSMKATPGNAGNAVTLKARRT